MTCAGCGGELDRHVLGCKVCSDRLGKRRLRVERRDEPEPEVLMAPVVRARVEREGVFCACGAVMEARVGTWIDTIESVFSSGKPFPRASEERIIWHGCEVCGAVTRETLLPASI